MRRKRKLNNFTYMVAVYIIMLLSISIGYSFLNTDLSLYTKANISKNALYDYEYSYTIGEIWGNYVYPLNVTVTYLGLDNINSWKAYIYVPSDSYINENGCIMASSCIINGNILTVTSPKNYNHNLSTNSSLQFSVHLATNSPNYVSDFKLIGMSFYSNEIDIENPPEEDISFIDYELKETGGWGTVTTYEFTITNNSDVKSIGSWKINYLFPVGSTITSCWDARYSYDDETGILSLYNPEWPESILPKTTHVAHLHVDTKKESGFIPDELTFAASTFE